MHNAGGHTPAGNAALLFITTSRLPLGSCLLKLYTYKSADSQSFFFPPEDDDEPQELKDIAEQVQQELEINKKIFGTPAFKHTSAFRGIEGIWTGEEWFIQARSLDISHRVSDDVIDRLMTDIRHNPPKPKTGTIEVDPTNTEVN